MADKIERYKIYIGGFLVLVILAGAVILLWQNKSGKVAGTKDKKSQITVDIEGAVKNPGVYNLADGSIIEDVIQAAGGFSSKVDKEKVASELNRAEILSDGQKILIPAKGATTTNSAANATSQTKSSSQNASSPSTTTTKSGKININTATAEELDSLSGIGPAYAQRIIEYRQSHGGFKSIEEITEIKGIGPKTFEKIKNEITI